MASAKKLNIHTEVLSDESSITKAIVEYAEKNDANLIVVDAGGSPVSNKCY